MVRGMTVAVKHLLLLAGAGEAEPLAEALESRADWHVTASHLTPPRLPWTAGVALRAGGFGGDAGFRDWLHAQDVRAVLDATHPFAARISARSARVCAEAGIPYAQLQRASWSPQAGDRWTMVPNEARAAALIEPGQRVFVTTGRATLADFAGHAGAHLFFRRLRPDQGTDAPQVPRASVVPGQGPFSVEQEIATFRALNIDLLITRNAGGQASRSKLDAARALGLPVILIARPPAQSPCFSEIAQALSWLDGLDGL